MIYLIVIRWLLILTISSHKKQKASAGTLALLLKYI